MFPVRKLARILPALTVISLLSLLLLTSLLTFLTSILQHSNISHSNNFYTCSNNNTIFLDDSRTQKSRFSKEIEFGERLVNLSSTQIEQLSRQYRRDVTIHFSKTSRRLLPASKPLYAPQCLDYLDQDYNVGVSVVLAYHNEMSVLLLRTLTTIMHRTSLRYLKEIILIDDYSSINITKEVKKYAEEQKMPIKFLINSERQGIANSRMRGIQEAEGDVVVILDTHMEVNDFWLEPLLNILHHKPHSIAVPLIHMILETEYEKQGPKLVEPFIVQPRKGHGHLALKDYKIVQDNVEREEWEPLPSPGVMGGGLAARRETLLEFYPVSVIQSPWGVENNRLSYRGWLCGEGVWISPCSQVLHPNGYDIALGRYFEGRYYLFNQVIQESVAEILNFIEEEVNKEKLLFKVAPSIDDHAKIRNMSNHIRTSFDPRERQCKNYKWYLNNVFSSYISWERDQFDHVGEVQSQHNPALCLEVKDRKLQMFTCRQQQLDVLDTHTTGFTKNKDVRNGNLDEECWDTNTFEERGEVTLYGCHVTPSSDGLPDPGSSQNFVYVESSRQIAHTPSGRCLEIVDVFGMAKPLLMKCSGKVEQRWHILSSNWF
ncbi:hypothetical protein ACHWQZ_G016010 [Mnemiopsis leidyi]